MELKKNIINLRFVIIMLFIILMLIFMFIFIKGTHSDSSYSYNIEFDLNGGVEREDCTYGIYTDRQCDYSAKKVSQDVKFNIFDPKKDGYVFAGWKLENFDEENAYISSNGMNLYLKDGFYDTISNEWKKFIKHIIFSDVILKNIGRENETVKLIAQWEEPKYNYNIEFDLNGGIGAENYDYTTRKIYGNESFYVYNPKKTGYKFIGWKLENFDEENAYISADQNFKYVKSEYYDSNSAQWLKYIDANIYSNIWFKNIGKANENVKLVAQWEEVYNYNIEFDLNGGIEQENYDYSSRNIYEDENIKIGDPSKTGHKFIGWKLENFDEENAYIDGSVDKYVKDGYYALDNNKWLKYVNSIYTDIFLKNIGKANENVKLVAQWEEAYSYNIEFDLNGGTDREDYDYSTRKIYEDETLSVGDPKKTGYKFIGWKLENFDEENAFIFSSIDKYVKDGYYDISSNKWVKYIDSSKNSTVILMDIGKANETVKLVAQWEELDDDIGSGGPIEDEDNSGNTGNPDDEDNSGNIGNPDDEKDNFGNVDENPQTGGIGIFVTIFIGMFMLGVSIYYFRNKSMY